jgi:tetratricopeptide (TPR) repeat protein
MEHRKWQGRIRSGLVALTLAAFGAAPAAAAPKGRDAALTAAPGITKTLRDGKLPKKVAIRDIAKDWRAEGDRLLANGDQAAALSAYEKALRSRGDDLDLARMVGDLHYHLGHPVEAVRAWVRALELAPRHPELLDRVARGASEVGDFELAAQAEGRLVDVLGEFVEDQGVTEGKMARQFRNRLAVHAELAALAGDFTTAEQAARRLIRFAPEATDGRLALAYVHLHGAEYDEAESLYREVLEVQPDNAVALNNLGNIVYMYRDFDAASELFEKILAVEGVRAHSESIALANLGELLQIQGSRTDAEYLYRQAIESQPEGAWGYMGLASLYDQVGKYDEAVEAMIDGWERDQNRLTRMNMRFYTEEWAWQRDALIAEIEGDVDLARALWTRILQGDVEVLRKSAAHHLHSLSLAAE